MPAATTLNSTNVRNSVELAWNRMHLTLASVLAPDKAVDAAARLFATAPRHAHTAPELEFLASGERFEVVADSAKLAAWRFGNADRPAVVVSHGWGGRGASERGESSLIHFMRDIEAVMARLETRGAKVAGLIGHSLGAAAAGAWLNASRRSMRAVLIAPPTSIERYSGWFARRMGLRESVRSRMQERFEHRLGHRAILRDPQVISDAVDFIADRVVFSPPPRNGEASAYFEPAPIA